MFLGGAGGFMGARANKTANAVSFNGSTQYLSLSSALTGAANSYTGILSFWFRVDGATGNSLTILSEAVSWCQVYLTTANEVTINLPAPTGMGGSLSATTTGTYPVSGTWHNFLCSWDTNFSAGNKVINVVVDGVLQSPTVSDASAAFEVEYTKPAWGVCAQSSPLNNGWFYGSLAELYLAPGQFLDFTEPYNVQAFISSSGNTVDLGPDGSYPTGVAPLLYLPNPASSVGVNAGTGGNFTAVGSPTTASSAPP